MRRHPPLIAPGCVALLLAASCSSSDDGEQGGVGAGSTPSTGGSGASAQGGAGAGTSEGGGGAPGERFPLSKTPGERFLREASGKPFFFHGDSAWSLLAEVTEEDAEAYLEDRRQKGFTVVLVSLLEHAFSDDPPNNAYGEPPFSTPGDYATPNEAYFAHADWLIQRARDKGMLVALTPSYIGYGGGDEGFYQEMVENGPDKLSAYGHFLGQRYKDTDNVMWVHGGDYNPPELELVGAIATGIRAETTLQLHTAHTSRFDTASHIWGGEAWLDVDNVYTGEDTYGPATTLFASTEAPFFLIESYYEGEHDMSEEAIRFEAYGALLGGAMGHFFGNNPIWCMGASTCFPTTASPPTWQGQLLGRGSLDMEALGKVFNAIAWERLAPAPELVTGGVDARAAVASDGSLGLVYARELGSLELDLSGFSGPVEAVRIDPTDASEEILPGSPFDAAAGQTLPLEGANATGKSDWLVRLTPGSEETGRP